MASARVYSTTAKGHDAIRDLVDAAFVASSMHLDVGHGMYERRLSDGSGEIALVGSAFDPVQQVVESLKLRLVGCRDISGEDGWEAFVYRTA